MSNPTTTVKVNVPKRSGFLKSYQNILTGKVGTLIPIFFDEVIPNSKLSVRMALSANMAPLATDVMMRCSLRTEAFFVPHRLLCKSYEDWFSQITSVHLDSLQTSVTVSPVLPTVDPASSSSSSYLGAGSLSDYLGCRVSAEALNAVSGARFSALPYLAYHLIWNEWYRRSDIQKSAFFDRATDYEHVDISPAYARSTYYNSGGHFVDPVWNLAYAFADGVALGSLRQRNFDADYFTVATTSAQAGDAQKVNIAIPESGDASFTIAALRAANSLQLFEERNNLPGDSRFIAQNYARYGANLNDGVAQRPLCLGTGEFEVYSKGIYQTGADTSSSSQNPFSSIATKYGDAWASGSEFIIDNFVANEPGYVFILASLVPRVNYSSGVSRILTRYTRGFASIVDMANPLLQNAGNQPIYAYEIADGSANLDGLNPNNSNPSIFGYAERYADWKTKIDEVHGLLRQGESLEAFVAQRSVDGAAIGSDFLKIPTNYLDNVTAVVSQLSSYGYWLDCFFDYRCSMPLSTYSIPSLQDPAYEHGHSITLKRGGFRF